MKKVTVRCVAFHWCLTVDQFYWLSPSCLLYLSDRTRLRFEVKSDSHHFRVSGPTCSCIEIASFFKNCLMSEDGTVLELLIGKFYFNQRTYSIIKIKTLTVNKILTVNKTTCGWFDHFFIDNNPITTWRQ